MNEVEMIQLKTKYDVALSTIMSTGYTNPQMPLVVAMNLYSELLEQYDIKEDIKQLNDSMIEKYGYIVVWMGKEKGR